MMAHHAGIEFLIQIIVLSFFSTLFLVMPFFFGTWNYIVKRYIPIAIGKPTLKFLGVLILKIKDRLFRCTGMVAILSFTMKN